MLRIALDQNRKPVYDRNVLLYLYDIDRLYDATKQPYAMEIFVNEDESACSVLLGSAGRGGKTMAKCPFILNFAEKIPQKFQKALYKFVCLCYNEAVISNAMPNSYINVVSEVSP